VRVDERQRHIRLALIAIGAVAAGLIFAASVAAAQHFESGGMGAGQDARAYWLAIRGPSYSAEPGEYGAYLYSPAFQQMLAPALGLAWQEFLALWTAMLMGALLLLSGPVLFVLMLPLAFFELWGGNITLLLALAIVVGFRYPASWSFVLLTKVTPGIGLLWFALRREWRNLAVALGATALVVGVSWLIDPRAWGAWLDLLTREAGSPFGPPAPGAIGIPLVLRLPVAALVVGYGALTNRRSLVPVAALIAMPVLWWGSLSLLIAVVALERERLEQLVERTIGRIADAVARRAQRPQVPLGVEPEG
jgi:hypothetical protein